MGSGLSGVDKINPNFSLRRYQPDQVQRVYLNSLQNTPKAMANVVFFLMAYYRLLRQMRLLNHIWR